MKLSTFLTINAVMFIPFGAGMLVVPAIIFPMLDVELSADGLIMASTVGSMLFSFGITCLVARNVEFSHGLKAVLFGNLSFHLIDSFLTFRGAYLGVMNELGYLFSSMHLILAIGFFAYLFRWPVISSQP